MTPEDREEAARLYREEGYDLADIAQKYSCSIGWLYLTLLKKKLITEDDIRVKHFERYYIIQDGKVYKRCHICDEVKLVHPKNFYFNQKGQIKYSRCKTCHKNRVVKERKER